MSKKKISFLTLSFAALLSLVSCGEGNGEIDSSLSNSSNTSDSLSVETNTNSDESSQDQDSSTGDTQTSEEDERNTIFDAYDESRPDFGDIFDFVDDYVKPEPPQSDMKVLITVLNGATFLDGSTSKEIQVGSILMPKDFVCENVEGRKIEGFSVEADGIDKNACFPSISVLNVPMKIKPVFSALEGFIPFPASHQANQSNCHGELAAKYKDIAYKQEVVVDGSENVPALKGHHVTFNSYISKGSSIRFDHQCLAFEKTSGVYEFRYNFKNFSETEELHLNAYQVNGSVDQVHDDYKTRHYRMDIDLLPGESTTIMGQYKLGPNKNKLLLIEAGKEMAKGFNFGYSAEVKLTDLENPETITKPEPTMDVILNLDLPNGIQVKDTYNKKVKSGSAFIAPTAEEIINTTGKVIIGWYCNELGMMLDGNAMIPELDNITISPVFANSDHPYLMGRDDRGRYFADYTGNLNASGEWKDHSVIFKQGKNKDNELTTNVTNIGALKADDYFRMLTYIGPKGTANGIQGGHTYRFNYVIENNSLEELQIQLIQVQGGVKFHVEEGAVHSEVATILPNECKTISIEIKLNGSNANIMTLPVIKKAVSKLNFNIEVNREAL